MTFSAAIRLAPWARLIADDRRQKLGRETHGQGQGKQKGIQDRAGEVDIDGKNGITRINVTSINR